jgi:hypothetical protein
MSFYIETTGTHKSWALGQHGDNNFHDSFLNFLHIILKALLLLFNIFKSVPFSSDSTVLVAASMLANKFM